VDNIIVVLDFRKNLGKRIKSLREERNLSREDVAYACDFSGSYMGMIERAEYDFKISKLYKISKALDVDISELFK
jgi:transcriptional regulator with XRE-family HTH domain